VKINPVFSKNSSKGKFVLPCDYSVQLLRVQAGIPLIAAEREKMVFERGGEYN